VRPTAISGAAAVAAALALVLSGCGSDTKAQPSPTTTTTTTTTTTAKAAPTTAKVAPRDEDAAGPNPTIASYIRENNIQETPVKRGDPGSPTIDLPFPPGWQDAGADTPEWAYGAIIYTGPEAAEYTPSIVALVSKLTGNVDPQQIIDLAPGELQNLPGYEPLAEGTTSTLGDYPAYQLGASGCRTGRERSSRRRPLSSPAAMGCTSFSSTRTD
jgi:Probable lipoprotein LpqN